MTPILIPNRPGSHSGRSRSAAADFQFQVSNLKDVTRTLTYDWSNTGDSANVYQASSITGGSATLTIRDPNGTVLYEAGLQNNGTFHTQKATPGTWRIQVVLSKADGTLTGYRKLHDAAAAASRTGLAQLA